MRNKFDTYYTKKDDLKKEWLLIDATSQYLGRLSSQIAAILRGKHKATFQPSVDAGDYVIVINADKIKISGKKNVEKTYYRYTGYPGGIKSQTYAELLEQKPERLIYMAVKRMLPKGRIGRAMITKLHIFKGDQHNHMAQKPKKLEMAYK
ncbi:MAG: 50S ribosomal protein L13 [Candidatus Margulisbacteria bacterium]|nr:50S ribosomal protein L13 [Candidatus Margulisiibacteriota bacterium]